MRNTLSYSLGDLNPFLVKIIDCMNEMHLTPSRLSKLAGLGSSTLSNLIKRNNVPSFSTMERICAVYGIHLSSFISDIEGDNPDIINNARSGVQRYDPLSDRKNKIVGDWSALPVRDRDETLSRILEVYGAQRESENTAENGGPGIGEADGEVAGEGKDVNDDQPGERELPEP